MHPNAVNVAALMCVFVCCFFRGEPFLLVGLKEDPSETTVCVLLLLLFRGGPF